MDKASEAILSLQPVTFRYKKDLDPAGILQFGLVAEQVGNESRFGGSERARQALLRPLRSSECDATKRVQSESIAK